MDSGEEYAAVVHDFQSYVKVYSDGRVEREMDYVIDYETGFLKLDFQPASVDDDVWLPSKDVKISSETDVSVRLFKPKTIAPGEKIPIVIYFHGGFFVSQSAFGALYHYFLDSLVTEANVIAVSVEYRRAPEQFLPVAYDDSWEAVKWVASHCAQKGPEEWLNEYGDFERVYFAGNEAGGNIAHNMAMRAGSDSLDGLKLSGLVLLNPFFGAPEEPISEEASEQRSDMDALMSRGQKMWNDELWQFVNPETSGLDDPLYNPGADPNLSSLGCSRVLVWVAELGNSKVWGYNYKDVLSKSGWDGKVEIRETKDTGSMFFLVDTVPRGDDTMVMLRKVTSFVNQKWEDPEEEDEEEA
ncbi:hypothetical protein RJ640_001485 [Escallonia rubra]|uniref:Alpha/beta hydrolase fold-3 domain-containing protein n=1 Tax=Escallonia rubra TaxID=112253 RepID=A0AA88QFB3_9ASTE|nr:hypothetical protein RJ640_001485 [Escallonia rubra]